MSNNNKTSGLTRMRNYEAERIVSGDFPYESFDFADYAYRMRRANGLEMAAKGVAEMVREHAKYEPTFVSIGITHIRRAIKKIHG